MKFHPFAVYSLADNPREGDCVEAAHYQVGLATLVIDFIDL